MSVDPDLSVPLLLCLSVYAVFLLGLFWSAPHYPTSLAVDPLAHAQITQSILDGDGRSELLHANYPVGLHFVAAILMALLGLNALESLRLLASLVLINILVLISLAAQALLGSKYLAALTTIVGAFVLPVDAMHLVLIGTYPEHRWGRTRVGYGIPSISVLERTKFTSCWNARTHWPCWCVHAFELSVLSGSIVVVGPTVLPVLGKT